MKSKGLLLLALVFLAVGAIGLILLEFGAINVPTSTNTSAERGALIYNTAADSSGQPIPFVGGMPMGASCADCHGSNGHGLRTRMFTSPNITYRNLTDPAGMIETDGSHGMKYTDDLIKRAVIEGVDAEGKPLAWPMPRWQLTDAQWSDLFAYLKTLN